MPKVKFLTAILCFLLFTGPVWAQDDASYERRLELARKIQDVRPIKNQVDDAIDQYAQRVTEENRDGLRKALTSLLSYKALEKIAIDAYADIYTEAELQAMYEYYQKPESVTAGEKYQQFADRVLPEIIRMLDKALMRIKTGG